MTPVELLDGLRLAGVELAAEGGRLRVDAPRGSLTPELRTELVEHRAELVDLLDPGYVLIETEDELMLAFADVLADVHPLVAFDLETYGDPKRTIPRLREKAALDPRAATIRLAQFTAGGTVYLADFDKIGDRRPLRHLVEHAFLIGHNLKFEVGMLHAAGVRLPEDLGYRLMDTMVASQVLAAGTRPEDGHGLAAVAKRHLGVELSKGEQTSDWSGELSAEQLRYAAEDVRHLLGLVHELNIKLDRAGLIETALMEYRALPAAAWLEASGIELDSDSWLRLAEAEEDRKANLESRMNGLAAAAGAFDELPLDLPPRRINWSSPDQVRALLRDRGQVLPDTDESTLVEYLDRDPIVPLLLEHREASRRVGVYGRPYLDHVHPVTGRIHPEWWQLGSDAGRMSCREPNLQQVPKAAAYRSCFRAPGGRVLVRADYSQIQLRIAAEIAPDDQLAETFRAGADVHSLTARAVLGRSEVSKADRQAAKAANFGLLYGMGSAGLRRYAKSEYGVEWTEEQAREYRDRFFATYAGLRAWHRRQPDHPIATRTLGGRRRLNIERFTWKLNSPIQGTGADMLKRAMGLAFETRGEVPSACLVLAVHDEMVVEVDEKDSELARGWLVRCMTSAAEELLHQVPVEVETTVGMTWGAE